jgi:hypothetical protein
VIRVKDNSVTFKVLNPDDYHEITGQSETFKRHEPDADMLEGFDRGKAGQWMRGDRVITPDGEGSITGFAVDKGKVRPFARVFGRLYHVSILKRVHG